LITAAQLDMICLTAERGGTEKNEKQAGLFEKQLFLLTEDAPSPGTDRTTVGEAGEESREEKNRMKQGESPEALAFLLGWSRTWDAKAQEQPVPSGERNMTEPAREAVAAIFEGRFDTTDTDIGLPAGEPEMGIPVGGEEAEKTARMPTMELQSDSAVQKEENPGSYPCPLENTSEQKWDQTSALAREIARRVEGGAPNAEAEPASAPAGRNHETAPPAAGYQLEAADDAASAKAALAETPADEPALAPAEHSMLREKAAGTPAAAPARNDAGIPVQPEESLETVSGEFSLPVDRENRAAAEKTETKFEKGAVPEADEAVNSEEVFRAGGHEKEQTEEFSSEQSREGIESPDAEGFKPLQSSASVSQRAQAAESGNAAETAAAQALEKIADTIISFKKEPKSFEILLEPERLGKLSITLTLGKEGILAQIRTEDAGVQNALAGQIGQLVERLAENGIQVENVDVFCEDLSRDSNGRGSDNRQREGKPGKWIPVAAEIGGVVPEFYFAGVEPDGAESSVVYRA